MSRRQLEALLEERGLADALRQLLEATLTGGRRHGCDLSELDAVVVVGGAHRPGAAVHPTPGGGGGTWGPQPHTGRGDPGCAATRRVAAHLGPAQSAALLASPFRGWTAMAKSAAV